MVEGFNHPYKIFLKTMFVIGTTMAHHMYNTDRNISFITYYHTV